MVMLTTFNTEIKSLSYYIELFFKEKGLKSKDTLNAYYNSLQMMSKRVFGVDVYDLSKNDIEKLTHDVLNSYKHHLLMSDNSNTTVNSRISSIKSFIRYLTARKAIKYDIAQLELVETLNDDSEYTEMIPLEILIEYTDYFYTHEKSKRLEKKLICLLALETGNRIQDLLSIKKSQFSKHGDDYILKSKGKNRGKGNKEYIKGVGKELYNELMNLNPELDKVFTLTYDSILNAFHRANKHFGNEDMNYTPHSIKHLAVTLTYQYTGDITMAQEIGNHESIDTTSRYLKVEHIPTVGAYTRMTSTKIDKYKEVELSELISAIDTLPMGFRNLLNQKLESMSNE